MTEQGDASGESPALGLFEGFGVEIEFMIVDADTLDVRPVADRLMAAVTGEEVSEAEFGPIAWSNELALHVLEMKTNGPVASLAGLAEHFHEELGRAEAALAPLGCTLLPGGAHPWMDPESETHLWPHEYSEVYRTFDRIFSCRGHGWSNVQSTHLNLSFADDAGFAPLHAAIRAALPLFPALAASSPFLDGRFAGALDGRMAEYATNARRVPSVAGSVVPESAGSRAEYESGILEPVYRDLAPLDPEGILRHEWVNGRGAIARFTRGTIEIRVLDPQECPSADLAVVRAISRVVHALCERVQDGDRALAALATERLAGILEAVVREAESAKVDDRAFLEALGLPRPGRSRRAGELWELLLARSAPRAWEGESPERDAIGSDPIEVILDRGSLARRILRRTGTAPAPDRLLSVYRELAECLRENRVFPGA